MVLIPIFVNIVSSYLTREKPNDTKASDLTKEVLSESVSTIEKPFDGFLQAHPVLMATSGVTIFKLDNGNQAVLAVLAVASTALKDDTSAELVRAEKVCRIKAVTSLLAQKQGIQIAHVQQLREKSMVVLDNSAKEEGVSELLETTRTKVEGIAQEMSPVGRWRSKDGKLFFLATGIVLDKDRNPIH